MDPPAFQIDDQEFVARALRPVDAPLLQRLCERCADFVDLVEGQTVSPGAAQELLFDTPAGHPISDKLLFGVFDRSGELVGVLEGMRHYPDENSWWIGLLMLAPEARGQGLGRKIVDGFFAYVGAAGGSAILLGVVEENRRAYQFWQEQGFALVRQTEPRTFGQKVQTVFVMRRDVFPGGR